MTLQNYTNVKQFKYQCPACGYKTNNKEKMLKHGADLYRKVLKNNKRYDQDIRLGT